MADRRVPNDDPMIRESREYLAYLMMAMIARDPKQTKAYKLGLVDGDGKVIKEAKTSAEKEALNPLEETAMTIHRIMGSKVRTLRMKMARQGKNVGDIATDFLLVGSN